MLTPSVLQQAIDYESRRQVELLETGASIDQETRLFDASTGQTRSMRSKRKRMTIDISLIRICFP